MRKLALLPIFFILLTLSAKSQNTDLLNKLPDSLFTGTHGKMHVQGVAVDKANGYIYFSFTNKLIKMDYSGKLIGSVIGFVGHLGDLGFNTENGKIYGSLEYKNDAIGKGIKKTLGIENSESGFYIAIFDGSRIVRTDMDVEKEDLLRTVYIKEALIDYEAKVKVGNEVKPHRFACSGIDGVTFGPAIGSSDRNKKYLYVAYGIYGDVDRDDNNQQVLLQYDVADWSKYEEKLQQGKLHHSGPEKPLEKYFVKTGSTVYGIQNLAYDDYTGNFFAAVYRGKKTQFPNYDLFVIDGHKKPFKSKLRTDGQQIKVKTLALLQAGLKDAKTGIRGWDFQWGSTGLCPLGNGLFYISHNGKTKTGQQYSTIHKYKWVGDDQTAFKLAR